MIIYRYYLFTCFIVLLCNASSQIPQYVVLSYIEFALTFLATLFVYNYHWHY